ncbi:phage portal protein [Photobacterium sp. 53610]|uniref:phage portal protein n=1 Tax=Photobacterium sp. 53610 TaxID=3102789 RepID=UPI002ED939A5
MTEAQTPATEQLTASSYSIDNYAEAVDSGRWLTDYSELFYNDMDDYWEPPISPAGLAQIARANAYHGSALIARSNYVTGRFQSGGGMRKRQLQGFNRDYFTFGHGALLKIRDHFGRVVRLEHISSMYLRRRKNGKFRFLLRDNEFKDYNENDIIWLGQYDPQQQIYGMPDYLGSIQSSMLNQDATMFRRRYYLNGAHMGFIFYATDPNLSKKDEDDLKQKIQSSKGVGNFRSMFVNIPNGNEKGLQLIPVGDIATKDEFERIKNITAQDILVGHRFPPGKGGMVPQGAASFGDPEKVGREYARDEIIPVCELIMDEVNNDPEVPKALHLKFNTELEKAS